MRIALEQPVLECGISSLGQAPGNAGYGDPRVVGNLFNGYGAICFFCLGIRIQVASLVVAGIIIASFP